VTATRATTTRQAAEKPLLLFFHSPHSGASRKAEAYLANVLQRCANHDTFALRRIDVARHKELARRLRVDDVPTLMVVEGKQVRRRLDEPNGIRPIASALQPWLRRAVDADRSAA
jgi:thioredoxin-like negative regulator of GroEL